MAKKKNAAPRTGDLPSSVEAARVAEMGEVEAATEEASLLPEVGALLQDQATAQSDTAQTEKEIAAEIALQESIGRNVAGLAAGQTGRITATGPVPLTPEEQFARAQGLSQRQDAFQAIVTAFTEYGIEGIADTAFAIMADPAIGDDQAIYKLKFDTSINPATNKPWNDAYAKRFAANFERVKAGKPAISEGTYLAAERSYAQALRSLGTPRLATRVNFNKFIAGDVSTDELVDRVTTAVNRVQNAPAETKAALAAFYPNLSSLDIAEAVLDPDVSLPALKRQIAAAEIGGAATRAGLGVGRQRAEELLGLGVTEQRALAGFQQVAEMAPRGGQLAAIYQESPYTQQTAEAEVFVTAGSRQAREQRERLTGKERAAFSGKSGVSQGALARDRAGTI